jgi:fatty-acyl-CoA synthase
MVALLALSPTGVAPCSLAPVDGVRVKHLSVLAQEQPADDFLGQPPTGSDLAALFHTGGTTGTPKLAAHTHANEVSDAWMIALCPPIREGAVVFAGLPLFHVNALHVTLLAPLFRGLRGLWAGPLGYRDQSLFRHFWRLVERYRVTTMSAVPTVYSVLASCPVDADISTLRFPVVGASPLPRAVRDAFEHATGIGLVEGYGLTEATCASVLSFPGHSRPSALGQRLPYQQLKAVEVAADGRWVDVPPGRNGVLVISGPTVFPGYVVDRGVQGPVVDGLGKLHDGWLDTGDLGSVDDEGFVSLSGRAKDLIIRGGHNIDPAAIEQALLGHPEVTAAQAVGRPDVHAGEVPVAFVTLAAAARVSAEELRAWASLRVPEQAASPKSVTVVDAIPLTEVGKPFKPPLRAEAARQAVVEALRDVPGVAGVRGVVEDGAVLTVVVATEGVDETAVKQTLDRFAITWRLEKS